jgi:hypothetical protein
MDITHEPDANRYVLSEGDEFLGEVEYQVQGTTLLLVRAEVPLENVAKAWVFPSPKEPWRPFGLRAPTQ